MAESKIEWTDAVWNPVTGCSKVSSGCANCYAEREWTRLSANPKTSYYGRKFNDVDYHPERLEQPLRWMKPRKIFVNSMSDLFHSDVPEKFVIDVFSVMAEARHHTFMILTKRPERMREILTSPTIMNDVWLQTTTGISSDKPIWPLPNVWIGVSVENQAAADERIPLLLQTPAVVRFISSEPLLGPISLGRWLLTPGWVPTYNNPDNCNLDEPAEPTNENINWCIVGGESGPKARPMHPDWARSLRDQCKAANVPFFFKQWGELREVRRYNSWPKYADSVARVTRAIGVARSALLNADGSDLVNGGPDHKVYPISHLERVGKKKAGRVLDGRTWDETP